MSKYICDKCGKCFEKKSHFESHTQRKNPCGFNNAQQNTNNLQCKYCNKVLSRSDALQRHMIKCKIKFHNNTNTHNSHNVTNSQNTNSQNTNSYNTNYNNTYNIKLTPFGQEDLSNIPNDVYCKMFLNRCYFSVSEFIKYVNFDKDKPENHNMYKSNVKDDYLMIFEDAWNLVKCDETLNNLYDTISDKLEDKFNELKHDKKYHDRIRGFQKFIDTRDDEKVIKEIKERIMLLAYNRRDLIKKTRKETSE